MRCVLRPTRVVRYALPIVLALAVTPAAVAETLVCHPIRRGESATQAARRLTGDARNTYLTSFQIMNPSSRFIPKSQYNRIRAGWRACVIKPDVERAAAISDLPPVLAAPETVAAPAALGVPALAVAEATGIANTVPLSEPASSEFLRAIGGLDLTLLWLGAAMVVPWVGWRMLDEHLVRRKTASIVMRHFAHRFVDEFERPLVRDDPAQRPLRSRVRASVRRGRLDILLAPGKGRRYPNLSDHKKNVEYDVARVMHALGDDSFVSGPLYTHAGWVVVPLQFLVRRGGGDR